MTIATRHGGRAQVRITLATGAGVFSVAGIDTPPFITDQADKTVRRVGADNGLTLVIHASKV